MGQEQTRSGGQPGGGHASKRPSRVDAGGPDPSLGVPARSAGAAAPPPLRVWTVPRGADARGSKPAVGGCSRPLDPHGHSRMIRGARHGGWPLSAPRAGETQVPRAARTGLQFPEGAEPGPGQVAEPRSVGRAPWGACRLREAGASGVQQPRGATQETHLTLSWPQGPREPWPLLLPASVTLFMPGPPALLLKTTSPRPRGWWKRLGGWSSVLGLGRVSGGLREAGPCGGP